MYRVIGCVCGRCCHEENYIIPYVDLMLCFTNTQIALNVISDI